MIFCTTNQGLLGSHTSIHMNFVIQQSRSVAAPEVISNKKHYDGVMADVWSSGVMLYVMLFGQYPFERPEDKKEANRYISLLLHGNVLHVVQQ